MQRSEVVAFHIEERDLQGYEDKLIGRSIGITVPKLRMRDQIFVPSIGI